MAYPTEEENRSHRRIAGINGDDDDGNNDDDDDDDVVRGNGNREARNRDLDARRVCGFKNDKNDFVSCLSDQSNGSSKYDIIDTSNSDFIYSYQIMASANQLPDSAEVRLSEPCHSRDPVCRQDEKENQQRPSERRSRKQSQPRQVKWHWDSRCNLIPALGLQDLTNVEPNKRQDINGKIQMISRSRQQKSIRQRMFKCHLCRKYAPTQGMSRRSYHNKASLILHMLWRHKRRSCYDKNRTSTINLSSTVSSITLKATFFTNPNYRYHR